MCSEYYAKQRHYIVLTWQFDIMCYIGCNWYLFHTSLCPQIVSYKLCWSGRFSSNLIWERQTNIGNYNVACTEVQDQVLSQILLLFPILVFISHQHVCRMCGLMRCIVIAYLILEIQENIRFKITMGEAGNTCAQLH
jgi:hypothetical protein